VIVMAVIVTELAAMATAVMAAMAMQQDEVLWRTHCDWIQK
jgi:hypothetical protein